MKSLLPIDRNKGIKRLLAPLSKSRKNWITVAAILILSAIPIGLVLLLHVWQDIQIRYLMADPLAIFEAPFYVGFLSQLGIFIWAAAAAIGLFTAHILSQTLEHPKIRQFFWASGFLSLWLGLDDVFLLHEEFMPYHVGIPEKVVFLAYGGFIIFYLLRFQSVIRRTDYLALGMAFVFFAISIGLDLITIPSYIDPFLFEDGAKFIGLVAWLTYFFKAASLTLSRNRL